MLKHLHIRNLAIIEELTLDFEAGFTVLTGETGAGKSILIDAISLIAGMRADSTLVRAGQDKAEVGAEFLLPSTSPALTWLEDAELADADDRQACSVRRIIYAEGRTRAFINGHAVNAGQLRTLGDNLIEIFGQSESQTLLRSEVQRQLLDEYGTYASLLEKVAAVYDELHGLRKQLEEVRNSARDPAQTDYLRGQVRELELLNLQEGELERLEIDHRRLSNTGRLLQDGTRALEELYVGDEAIYDRLAKIGHLLESLASFDPTFSDFASLTDAARAHIRDAGDQIRRLLDRMEMDPDHLQAVERRIGSIHDAARKYRIKPGAIASILETSKIELQRMESHAGALEVLQAKINEISLRYTQMSRTLHAERSASAEKFSKQVCAVIHSLGMPNAQFAVAVNWSDEQPPRRYGMDTIEFLFSANPGQPLGSLAKIASGGELSRISLAIQVVGRKSDEDNVMIFDEVDAGIGGATAEIVGQKLRALGRTGQVFCVTHLAQVAAQSHHHFGIKKTVSDGQTYTQVVPLTDKVRVEEIARMQGGIEMTPASLNHARDLLKRAAK